MPIYEFEAKDGEIHEEFFPMEDAPALGSWITRAKKRYQRIPTPWRAKARKTRHFAAMSMDPWEPGAPRYDKDGAPCFTSQREVDEFVARSEGKYVYDDQPIIRQKASKR